MKLNINGKEIELSDDELSKALESKQESFEVASDLILRTTEEDNTLRENVRGEGMTAGQEIGRKGLMKGLGLEGEGNHKTEERALEALNAFSTSAISKALEEANIEPSKQLEGFQKDMDILKEHNSTLQSSLNAVQSEFSGYKKQNTITKALSDLIPDNTILPKGDILTLMNGKIKADVDENGNVFGVGLDGLPIKNKLLEVSPMKDLVSGFFNDNPAYLKSSSGGAAGTDSGGGSSKQSIEEFAKEMQDKDIMTNSPEYVKEMITRQKAGTLD